MPVTAPWITSLMLVLASRESPATSWASTYDTSAEAIATAANASPLPKETPEFTGALLVALAWHESRLNPAAVGDNGHSFGLFQVQPPTAQRPSTALLEPETATPIALGLLRRSWRICAERSRSERLSWYAAGGAGCSSPAGARSSRIRVSLAERLLRDHPP